MRLSAIGDVCHTLAVVRALQRAWPSTRFTWIIGKTEHSLVGDIPGIRFVVFDKARGWRAFKLLRDTLKNETFDLLLHMQEALRASMATLMVKAKLRLGYNKKTSQDFQWLFTTHQIDAKARQHYLDVLFGFAEAVGVHDRNLVWDIPISVQDERTMREKRGNVDNYIVISPCSSNRRRNWRNWTIGGYAGLADYAYKRHGLRTILTGGKTEIEQEYAAGISALSEHKPINLVGQLNLKQLLALIRDANAVIAPDSGPAHMAVTVGTPSIGLFATSNPLFTGPYVSRWVVNKYPEALEKYYRKRVDQVPWGKRVRYPDAMAVITLGDVAEKLDAAVAEHLNV